MKRAPIVVGATAVGLGLVLSFRTHQPTVKSIASSSATSNDNSTTTTTTTAPVPATAPATTTPATTSPTTASATRTAIGEDVRYRYGDIELRVTEKSSRITDIQVVRNGASDPRSSEINSEAVPLLQQQAMSAQSANIDGVSGASFTSAAYAQSLQSALDQMKA